MKLSPRSLAVILFSTCSLIGLATILLNPFDWFLERSERFSVAKFLTIEPGMEITDVVDRLGEPIRTEQVAAFHDCQGCTAQYFLGNPPDWLIVFREAWVIVDSDGKVVSTILLEEP